jgi:hypothetical protein
LATLELDRDALVGRYTQMVPEDIDALTPEKRHHVYKLLKLQVRLHADGTTFEVSGMFGDELTVCKAETLSGANYR